jgi:hypothetical protein
MKTKMSWPQVGRPEAKTWVYWIIRCRVGGNECITYARQMPNGHWNNNGVFAKKFTDRAKAIKIAAYLTKRQKTVSGQLDWGRRTIEVIKCTVERKHSVEWPLGLLERIAKV